MNRRWKCSKCRHVVEAELRPDSRWEPTLTVAVPGEHNSYRSVDNPNTQQPARHSSPVCFGPERGEDYYEHNWQEVTEPDPKQTS